MELTRREAIIALFGGAAPIRAAVAKQLPAPAATILAPAPASIRQAIPWQIRVLCDGVAYTYENMAPASLFAEFGHVAKHSFRESDSNLHYEALWAAGFNVHSGDETLSASVPIVHKVDE